MEQDVNSRDGRRASGRSGWKQDPAGVRSNILAVAMAEFAANGLSVAATLRLSEKQQAVRVFDLPTLAPRATFTGPDGYEAVHIHANPRFITEWLE